MITPILCATLVFSDGDSGRCTTADGTRHRIRLSGIDAGETRPFTRCRHRPDIWACQAPARAMGPSAQRRAAQLASGPVGCLPVDNDRYGRIVARCTVNGVDIGGVLVREGLARSDPDYGNRYARQESMARRDRVGVWG
jgi:endonuclease YncB( thermonuclease family)